MTTTSLSRRSKLKEYAGIRDGSTKREKSQQRITQAPDVLNDIMLDANASPRA